MSDVARSTTGICRVMSSDQSQFTLNMTLNNAEKIFQINSSNYPGWNLWAFSDLYIQFSIGTLRYPEQRLFVSVQCIKTSGNPHFPFKEVRLQARRCTGIPVEIDFELYNKAECRNCAKHSISHLCVSFEMSKEDVQNYVRDGRILLRFSLY